MSKASNRIQVFRKWCFCVCLCSISRESNPGPTTNAGQAGVDHGAGPLEYGHTVEDHHVEPGHLEEEHHHDADHEGLDHLQQNVHIYG